MKVALLGVGHWHCPLYLPGLTDDEIDIVGVADPMPAACERIAEACRTNIYKTNDELLDHAKPDFVFAFAPHAAMPQLAANLIRRQIPFVMEKPFGLTRADVAATLAIAGKLFIAVPFIYRISGLRHAMENAMGGFGGGVSHLSIRNIAGPPQRYSMMGVPWMLDRAISGGGCLINLAVHFIDFAILATRQPVSAVSCRTSNRTYGLEIEDYAALTLCHGSGAISTVEVGYTFPQNAGEKREFTLSCASERAYIRTVEDGLRVTLRPSETSTDISVELDTDVFYETFARQTLADFAAGRAPSAGVADMALVMGVVDAAYRSAADGGALTHVVHVGKPQ
ncbi:Gfo/Idh/MocA family protein [Bosea sp. PAMC 26642]|uniref:Gfo/Idh/MocA family protein n=1 Tax=Bosea sp. (strain PAMC 26642) TaxID=1792307 RepID=UPI00076FF919|nr:Gfo/Idh/MocA family oxidoreductase [Bosea sp. PAMC 26642]AMJ61547.1 hypothetical protein AXW83_15650 [Bosea sp. PAMC 26642]